MPPKPMGLNWLTTAENQREKRIQKLSIDPASSIRTSIADPVFADPVSETPIAGVGFRGVGFRTGLCWGCSLGLLNLFFIDTNVARQLKLAQQGEGGNDVFAIDVSNEEREVKNRPAPNRVHAKGVVLCERECFCLLSAFYTTPPSKNPSKNLCLRGRFQEL